MKVHVTLSIENKKIDEVLTGTNAEDILTQAKGRVAKEMGWKGLVINAMSPLGFAQKAIQLYNDSNKTHYDLPQSADEFIKLGQDLGYVTVLPDDAA